MLALGVLSDCLLFGPHAQDSTWVETDLRAFQYLSNSVQIGTSDKPSTI